MWARKKREPLVMKEGVEVRDLEGLRENFDLELILKYYKDGTLLKWLKDWHCDEEAAKVYELDEKEDNGRALCEILGVDYLGTDPEEIAWRTERLNRLKEYTSDHEILTKVDNVAFDEEDLFDILDEGKISDIYLCGDEFILPSGFLHFTEKNYHGVGKVKVKIDVNEPIDFDALEITFENIQLEGCELVDNNTPSAQIETVEKNTAYESHSAFYKFDDFQSLKDVANSGNVAAMIEVGNIYLLNKDDLRHAAKWYRKAAENNVHFNDDDDEAMYLVALAFKNSIGGDENAELAFQWMQRAAQTGRIDATAELGAMYLYGYGTDTDFVKAYELIKKAVDEDNAGAMKYFGDYFIKCDNDYTQAGTWYKKAADKGNDEAQEMLEELARRGEGDKDYSQNSNMHVYSDTEAEATVTIENIGGLHARPASIWIQTANSFPCKIHITANGTLIDAKNLIMLMSLCITRGTEITIYANGTGAVDAVKTLKKLVENKFGIE